MALREQLDTDLLDAIRSQDEVRKLALRGAKTAILNAEIEKRGQEGPDAKLTDEEVLVVMAKQAKQRRESIAEFAKADRDDLVQREAAELAVLEAYLPRQLTPEEISEVVRQVIVEVGATDPKQMGLVMRPAMERLRGQADGRLVNQIARDLLSEAA